MSRNVTATEVVWVFVGPVPDNPRQHNRKRHAALPAGLRECGAPEVVAAVGNALVG
jgi:hypothetical protein